MKLVVIESPLAGDRERNRAYARACMRDSIRRGEAPLASHLLYDQPGLLDDNDPAERILGIQAGFAWAEHAELVAVYIDLGISAGMDAGIMRATNCGQAVEHRKIGWTK